KQIVEAMGGTLADLFPPRMSNGAARRIVATYDYCQADGRLLYQVVRYEPKEFRQRRPDGRGGWIWNLQGVERVLYNLPAIAPAAADDWLLIVEGEKDVDALAKLGVLATTNPHGAGKWLAQYNAVLTGRKLAILPDHDGAGRAHARQVA